MHLDTILADIMAAYRDDWTAAMTVQSPEEQQALDQVLGWTPEQCLDQLRFCFRSIKEGEEESPDIIEVDRKGFPKPGAKRKMPFQPTAPEFVALYGLGYRLCHWSMAVPEGPKIVIHYWADPATGRVVLSKIKR